MSLHAKLMITAMLLGNAVLVLELLRKRKLAESYTLLWFFVILGTIAATWSDWILFSLARFFGATVPLSALTLLSLVFILIVLIVFSMKISRLSWEVKKVAQEMALRCGSVDLSVEHEGGNGEGKTK